MGKWFGDGHKFWNNMNNGLGMGMDTGSELYGQWIGHGQKVMGMDWVRIPNLCPFMSLIRNDHAT